MNKQITFLEFCLVIQLKEDVLTVVDGADKTLTNKIMHDMIST